VSDTGKRQEHPVVFTNAIHNTPALKEFATKCMGEFLTFLTEFRNSQQQRYVPIARHPAY